MHLEHLRWLNGPNVYLARPVVIARLDLGELTERETTDVPGFAARLESVLPGLADHHCSAGRPGGLLAAMARGTYFGHVTEHVTLELSAMIGRDVCFGRTVWAGAPGCYDVILERPWDEPAEGSPVGGLIELAIRTVTGLVHEGEVGGAFDAGLAALAAAYERTRLGVSTAALAAAARRRGIPVRRVGDLNLLHLGYGRYRRTVWAAMTDRTSAIGVEAAGDKMLTKRLLEAAGLPVPEGLVVTTAEEAIAAFREIGAPVVVKPPAGHHGAGVAIELTDPGEVAAAFRTASADEGAALVEAYVPGRDHRVLVVGDRVVAAAELSPARVTGDGTSTIAELVAAANADPARGEGHDRPLTRLALGPTELGHLARQGLRPDSVPDAGQGVTLRRNANLSTGGTSRDVTDSVHPDVVRLCRRVAATVGLDICGIDLRLPDITAPLPAGASGVIEVNASPGLRMHLAPYEGRPRDVAAEIIDRLYPPGTSGRVPIVSVTGTNGKTTTVRMIAHILAQDGRRVGMTTTEGVYVGGELVYKADASGPRSAAMVLGDRTVDAAVLETARGGIVRRGLGYDRADVAVLTNITDDHLGVDDITTVDDLVEIKALVAEEIRRGGHLVLNADDPRTAALAERPRVRDREPVVRYFGMSATTPCLTRHLGDGGVAYFVEDGALTEGQGTRRYALLPVADVAGAFGGRACHVIGDALAAAAAARALGVPADLVARGLRSFDPHELNPGRGCAFLIDDRPIVVDYAHNPAAVAAAGELLRQVWGRDGVAAVTLPGDRCDELVIDTARAVARSFGRVVVYEDEDLRGRRSGEMSRLIVRGLVDARPDVRCHPAGDLKDAVGIALGVATPGEPILLLYEKLQPVMDLLDTLGAVRVPSTG